jgi:prepilin-type N-terminal cleavage/methylation domain-containing protein
MKRDLADAGFTLVEVLVSLALLSILSVYALSAIRLQKDMNQMQADIARKLEVRAALDAIQTQLQGMQLVFLPGQNEQRNLIFEGHKDRVTFAGLSDGSRVEGGLYRMTLLVDQSNSLLEKFEPLKSAGFGPTQSIVLLDGVTALMFSYRSEGITEAVAADWLKNDQLPKVVGVGISLGDDKPLGESRKNMQLHIAVQLAQ